MKNRILVFLFTTFLSYLSNAQHGEFGLQIGASVYQGDLTPSQLWTSVGETHVAYGAFYRQNLNDYFALKLGFMQGTISGDDATSKDAWRKERNLSFKSPVSELALTAEFNFPGYQPYNLSRPFSPYLFAGIALFRFNPKAELNGDWHKLQALGTEGQYLPDSDKSPYKLTQFSIPMGIGFKYALNDTWNIGLEMGSRMTFTDYLDDVSGTYVADAVWLERGEELTAALANRSPRPVENGDLRGDEKDNDWYIMGALSVSYNFLDNGLAGFRNRNRPGKSGCPTF